MSTHDPKPPQNIETLRNLIESRQREKRTSRQKSDQELRKYPEYRDFPSKLTKEWRQQKKTEWQKSGKRLESDLWNQWMSVRADESNIWLPGYYEDDLMHCSGHRMFPDMAKLVLELSNLEAIREYNTIKEQP